MALTLGMAPTPVTTAASCQRVPRLSPARNFLTSRPLSTQQVQTKGLRHKVHSDTQLSMSRCMGHGPGALLHKPAKALPRIRKGQGARGSPEETGASGLTGCRRGFAARHSWGRWTGAGSSAVLTGDETRNHWGQPLILYTDGKAEVLWLLPGDRGGARRPLVLAHHPGLFPLNRVPKTRPVTPTTATKRPMLQKGPSVSRKRRKAEVLVWDPSALPQATGGDDHVSKWPQTLSRFHICHGLAVRSWTRCLSSLGLSFFIWHKNPCTAFLAVTITRTERSRRHVKAHRTSEAPPQICSQHGLDKVRRGGRAGSLVRASEADS